jgi:hypothetical protein
MEKISCKFCSKFKEYYEIENLQDENRHFFPQEFENLIFPNSFLEEYYRYDSERLLKCKNCEIYYFYHNWSPGGSEDVFKTYIHESVNRITYLQAYKKLQVDLYRNYDYFKKFGGSYENNHKNLSKGIKLEQRFFESKAIEIIKEAIEEIEHKYQKSEALIDNIKHYYKNPLKSESYKDAVKEDEKMAIFHANVILMFLPKQNDEALLSEVVCKLNALKNDNNPKIVEIFDKILEKFA